MFAKNADISSAAVTRNTNKLSVSKHTTTIYERGCYYRAIVVYNSLPDSIRGVSDTNKS